MGIVRIDRCNAVTAIILLLILASSYPLQAESVLNFPRLSHEQDTLTGIAIVNPTDSEATLTVVAYGEDGLPLAGINNPASLEIPPNQQLALLTTELFGNDLDPEAVAWFQARSPVNDLTGFFLFLNSTATLFDGADLPPTADSIILNQVRSGSGFSTELNVINPSAGDANLEISIQGGGVTSQTQQVFLPSMGVVRLDIFNLFGIGEVGPGAFVQVDSDVRIGGFQFIRQAGGDLQGLNARDATEQLTSLYFPQMTVLGPWVAEMGLVNYSDQSVIATISAYTADGLLFDAADLQTNPVTRALAPGESLLEDVATMFGFKGTDVQDGWIQVEATSPSLNGFISYGLPSVGSVATVAATAAARQGIFSHIATLGGLFTGVAILNPAQLSTDVRVLAIQPDGTVLGSHSMVLLPGQRESKLINQLIPEATNQGGGLIWVKSDAPVYLTSLFGSDQILANIPAQPSPNSYQPDANLPLFQLSPTLTILQPTSSHTFQVVGSEAAPIWRVDGEEGGNSESGSITAQGVYTAPAVPPEGVITVTAEANGQSTGATVDVLEKSAVLESQTVVQSVAYLGSLQSLYTAELALLGGFASGQVQSGTTPTQEQTVGTQIFQLSASGVRQSVLLLPGETVTKIVPYEASNGQELLLLAAETSGRVYRMDPSSLSLVEVASGLNQPSAIALDEASGDLFVAERDRISVIPKDDLEVGLESQTVLAQVGGEDGIGQLEVTAAEDARGIAVDNCTGDIYFTSRKTGEIKVYSPVDGVSVVVSGLRQPTRLLAAYRDNVPCPVSFHLLVIEEGTDRILLVLPSTGLATVWASGRQSTDLAFLPPGNPFTTGQAILFAEAPEEKPVFQVSVVPVTDIYEEQPALTEVKSTRVLAIADQTAEPETKVLVPVALSEGSGITALAFLLEYDPNLLELGVVQGESLLTDHQVESEVGKGRAEIVVQSPTSASLQSGAGSLVELIFVLQTSGISKLGVSQAKAAGLKGNEILLTTRSGTLGDERVVKEEKEPVVRVLSAPQLTPAPGGQVIVPIQLSDGSGITDLGFTLFHDPAVLGLSTVQPGSLLVDHIFKWDGEGEVAFKVASTKGQSMNPGSGSVVELVFDVAPSGASKLSLANAFGVAQGATAVDLATTSGIVIITEEPGVLEIPFIEASPGEKTIVGITLNQTEDIAILQFELLYDPAVLVPLDAQPGTLFRDHILKFDFSQKGIIVIDIVSYQLTPLAPGPGTMVDLIFGVLSSPQSNSPVAFQRRPSFSPLRLGDILAFDSRKSPVKLDATSGSVGEVATRVLSAPTLSAVRGEVVTIPINLSQGQDVGLVDFELEFDPDILAFGEAHPGALLGGEHSVRADLQGPGLLGVTVASDTLASFGNGSGSIAELIFKMIGFGTSPLTFLSASAIDPGKIPLDLSTVDGSAGDGTEPRTTVGRTLSFSSAEASVDDTVEIEALLPDGTGLAAVRFNLFYDPGILTFREAGAGSLATDHAVKVEPGKGFISVGIASPTLSSFAKGEGSVAKLAFEAPRGRSLPPEAGSGLGSRHSATPRQDECGGRAR